MDTLNNLPNSSNDLRGAEHKYLIENEDEINTNPLEEEVSQDCDKSTLMSSVANLALGVLGAGQLTLPFAIKSCGLAVGATMLFLIGCISMYVLVLLSVCAQTVRRGGYNESISYGVILEKSIGSNARVLANILLALYAWGGAVSFLVMMSDMIGPVCGQLNCPEFMQNKNYNLPLVTMVLVLPMTICRSLDKLKITSLIGSFCAIFVTFVVVYKAPWGDGQGGVGFRACQGPRILGTNATLIDNHLRLVPTSALDAMNAIPLMAFAFNSAWCYTNVLANLKDNHLMSRCYKLIFSSHLCVLLSYSVMSITGYLSFCDETNANIINNLGTSGLVSFTRVFLIMQLCFALPMRFHVMRDIMYCSTPFLRSHLCPRSSGIKGRFVCIMISSLLYVSAVAVALLINNLEIAIGLTSAVCASFLIYIFPTLCYIKLLGSGSFAGNIGYMSINEDDSVSGNVYVSQFRRNWKQYTIAIVILLFGVFVLVGGVTGIIILIIQGKKPAGG